MSAFDNVAARLKEHLPYKKDTTTPITAWADQAKLLNRMAADLTALENRVDVLEGTSPEPTPEPEPTPIPPQRYAPRTYNSHPAADARFCMKSEFGVVRDGAGYRDAMGVQYDEAGRDLGGRTKTIVPELKYANSMDGKEPCDPYTGPTGKVMPPYPPTSFER